MYEIFQGSVLEQQMKKTSGRGRAVKTRLPDLKAAETANHLLGDAGPGPVDEVEGDLGTISHVGDVRRTRVRKNTSAIFQPKRNQRLRHGNKGRQAEGILHQVGNTIASRCS